MAVYRRAAAAKRLGVACSVQSRQGRGAEGLVLFLRPSGALLNQAQALERVVGVAGQGHEHRREPVRAPDLAQPGGHRDRHQGHQRLVRELVPGEEVGAERPRGQRQYDVVHCRPEGVLESPDFGQARRRESDAPAGADGHVPRGARRGQGERARGRSAPTDPRHVEELASGACRRVTDVARSGQAGQGGLRQQLEWRGDPGVEVSRAEGRSIGGFGLEVEEHAQQLGARDSVDGAVVDLGHHGHLVVLESFDDPHLPQRPVPMELAADHVAGEFGQLADPSGGGQRGAAEVVVDVELGVVDPHRATQAERHLDQPASEHGGQRDALIDDLAHPPEGVAPRHGGRVQHGDQGDVHVQGRCLRVEEGGVEPAQPFRRHVISSRQVAGGANGSDPGAPAGER